MLNTPILTEDTGNIFGYAYHELVGILCYTLEDISTFVENDVLYSKSDMPEDIWDSMYSDEDTNKDGELTSFESIIHSLDIILEDINNYR